MSKEGKIALYSFLLIASIVLLIVMFVCKYNIYLNEYNAQMQQLGYYKEDIHLLNQAAQTWFTGFGIVVFILSIVVWGACLFTAALE